MKILPTYIQPPYLTCHAMFELNTFLISIHSLPARWGVILMDWSGELVASLMRPWLPWQPTTNCNCCQCFNNMHDCFVLWMWFVGNEAIWYQQVTTIINFLPMIQWLILENITEVNVWNYIVILVSVVDGELCSYCRSLFLQSGALTLH